MLSSLCSTLLTSVVIVSWALDTDRETPQIITAGSPTSVDEGGAADMVEIVVDSMILQLAYASCRELCRSPCVFCCVYHFTR